MNSMLRIFPIEILVFTVFLIASLFSASALNAIPILMLFILYWTYSLFYTEKPYSAWFFYAIGLAASTFQWEGFQVEKITLGGSLILLECIRVYLMAILRYPKTIHDLKSLNEGLEQRVNQRTAELDESHKKLQAANDELLELDRMKSAFVSQASHDLRTPLTAIKGSIDNLMMGIAGGLTDKQQTILTRAQKSVDRLALLVNDILDLNRIESGRMALEKQTIHLHQIIECCLNENKPAADLKSIQMRFESSLEIAPLFADPGKIERVIGELIGNAIKYTNEGGTITLSLRQISSQGQRQPMCYEIQAQDSGIGMEPEECEKIWERFYRSPAAQKSAVGSGLGLSIVKELVEAHGGTIQAQSQPGRGTLFTIQLPCETKGA